MTSLVLRLRPAVAMGAVVACACVLSLGIVLLALPAWGHALSAAVLLMPLLARLPGFAADLAPFLGIAIAIAGALLVGAGRPDAIAARSIALLAVLAALPIYVRGFVLSAAWVPRRCARLAAAQLLGLGILTLPVLLVVDHHRALAAGVLLGLLAVLPWLCCRRAEPTLPGPQAMPLLAPLAVGARTAGLLALACAALGLGELIVALLHAPQHLVAVAAFAAGFAVCGLCASRVLLCIVLPAALLGIAGFAVAAGSPLPEVLIAMALAGAVGLWPWLEGQRTPARHRGGIAASVAAVPLCFGVGSAGDGVVAGAGAAAALIALIAVAVAEAVEPQPAVVAKPAGKAQSGDVLGAVPDPASPAAASTARRPGHEVRRHVDAWLSVQDPVTRRRQRRLLAQPEVQALADEPRRWGRVLDVRCGAGLTAAIALARGDAVSWLGLDRDEEALTQARRLLLRAGRVLSTDFRLIDVALPLPGLPSERFDTILCTDRGDSGDSDAERRVVLAQLAALLAEPTADDPGGVLWLRQNDDPTALLPAGLTARAQGGWWRVARK